MRIIRVFPTGNKATPDDDLVRINTAPVSSDEADEIHISVAFTWDMEKADILADKWKSVAPVKIGGPAFNEPGGNFIPGMYLKKGYVITSRGCPNRCWFCKVPIREGYVVRELPITDGWILQDDNLLSCSKEHIDKVFEMLKRQPNRPEFTGGLEAKILTPEMAIKIKELKPKSIYFAYDTEDDLEPLIQAGKYLQNAGFKKSNRIMYSYVLCGFKRDTIEQAEKRMKQAWDAGFVPCSMLYRDKKGETEKSWRKFHREWSNPIIRGVKLKELS